MERFAGVEGSYWRWKQEGLGSAPLEFKPSLAAAMAAERGGEGLWSSRERPGRLLEVV